jgi:hypothetical protein
MSKAQITISGLVNTTQPSGTVQLLDRNLSSTFVSTAEWDQVTGTIVLSVQQSNSLISFTTYILSFVLTNPASGYGVVPDIIARGSTAAEVFDALPMTVTQGAEYCLAINTFLKYQIGQAVASARAWNTLTVTFSTSVSLFPGSRIAISNLTITNTSDGFLTVNDLDGSNTFNTLGTWAQNTGTLICTVQNSTVPFVAYRLSFVLQNPAITSVGQDSLVVLIEVTEPSTIAPIALLRGAENHAPLLIARFQMNSIRQSTPSAGSVNTIRASFSSNVKISGTISDIEVLQGGQGNACVGV